MQYWINFRGVQSGPVDIEGLKEMALTSDAYVWHEGMADWMKITQVPELQGLYQTEGKPVVMGEPMETQPDNQQPEYQQAQPEYQQMQPVDYQPSEPCPPNNLIWAILATVLCCIPLGIVGIVYANKVTKCYAAGDIRGAKEASETSAWWCIAAIVIGVVTRPIIMSMMGA